MTLFNKVTLSAGAIGTVVGVGFALANPLNPTFVSAPAVLGAIGFWGTRIAQLVWDERNTLRNPKRLIANTLSFLKGTLALLLGVMWLLISIGLVLAVITAASIPLALILFGILVALCVLTDYLK